MTFLLILEVVRSKQYIDLSICSKLHFLAYAQLIIAFSDCVYYTVKAFKLPENDAVIVIFVLGQPEVFTF